VAPRGQAPRTLSRAPAPAARRAELAGADQITIHLREDRRHVQERDLQILRKTVSTRLNLEMAATQDMVKIAYEQKPDLVTLVPERREELTTEGGLDVVAGREAVRRVVKTLRDADIEVSLFIDCDLDQVKAAHRIEAQVVEFHTGRYCEARLASDRRREMGRLVDACKAAAKLGLAVAAGHGLNYQNVQPVAAISEVEELNIGHAIVARAMLVGMERAVREMKALVDGAR
jgi:pyridoxine 5-phosphate synthase